MIGLGRMGYNMVERLLKHKHSVVAYNRSQDKVKSIAQLGAIPAYSVEELVNCLDNKKIVWLMLPAGEPTDTMIQKILPLLNKDDILINGANSFYENAEKHDSWCRRHGVHFFDIGVSGQIWGIFTVGLVMLITIPFTVLTLYYGVKAVQIEKDKNPFISGMLLLLFFLVFIIISRVISPERGDLIFQVSLLIPVVILIFSTVKLISEHTVKKI